jgi:hypothetical protein
MQAITWSGHAEQARQRACTRLIAAQLPDSVTARPQSRTHRPGPLHSSGPAMTGPLALVRDPPTALRPHRSALARARRSVPSLIRTRAWPTLTGARGVQVPRLSRPPVRVRATYRVASEPHQRLARSRPIHTSPGRSHNFPTGRSKRPTGSLQFDLPGRPKLGPIHTFQGRSQ